MSVDKFIKLSHDSKIQCVTQKTWIFSQVEICSSADTVSKGGVEMDQLNLAAVEKMESLTNFKEVRVFFGFIDFRRIFPAVFRKASETAYHLLKKSSIEQEMLRSTIKTI